MKLLLALASFAVLNGFPARSLAEEAQSVQSTPGAEKSEVDLPRGAAEVGRQVEGVFKDLGIQLTSMRMDDSGAKQVFKGRRGENSVEVQLIQRVTGSTHVSVIAKKGLVALNHDLAQQVLEKLIRAS